jgi:Ca-activated chloride channel homolog
MVVHIEKESTDFSYVLAIDSSESMIAEDYSPNRLSIAKESAINFVDLFPRGIRLGVVSFSGITKIENKITEDKLTLKSSIKKISLSEVGGTNLLMLIQTSVNLLANENAKAIILLSDGQINIQGLEEVISYSNENNVVIHTIAIGSKEGGKVNNYFLSKVDEDSLKSIAYSTGGKYFHISSENELNNAFRNVIDFTSAKFSFSLKNYLLISSIILICIIWVLWCTRFKIIP